MKTLFTLILFFITTIFTTAQGSLDSSLVVYLPLNGNTNDLTGNGYDGTINGNATLVPDRFNSSDRAFTFPDQSSSISLENSTNMNLEYGFTINAWVRYKSGGTKIIACKHVCGFVNGFLFGVDTDGQIQLWLGQSGWSTVRTNQTFVEDKWYMMTATYDTSSSMGKIYIDGELRGSGSVAYNNFSSNPISIGESYQNNCIAANMDGAVDEVKIYNRALSAAEIINEYNKTYTDLVLFLPFNGNANDESILANHGTVYDALLTKDRYANSDQAYYFNGSTGRIEVPYNPSYSFGYGDFTISAWVNISDISTARIVSAGHDTNDSIWGLGFGTNPVWGNGIRINYFVYSDNDFRDFSSDEFLDYSTGKWVFVTASKTGNQIKFYTNGLPIGTQTISYPSNANSLLSIGCRQYSPGAFNEFFNGEIDEVKIFNRSFSDQEIWNMYKETTTSPTLLFPPDDATINTLTPVMDWDSLVTATNYLIQIATDSLFSMVIFSQFSDKSSYSINAGDLSANTDYFWRVRTNNGGGVGPWSEVNKFRIVLTDVEFEKQLPKEFALLQNYPNPFNPGTIIKFEIPKTSFVTLKIYNLLGQEVAELVNEEKQPGKHSVIWNSPGLASGVYFYKLYAKIINDEPQVGSDHVFMGVKKLILSK